MPRKWYVRTHGELFGPYGEDDLRQFVDKDRLTPETDVAESVDGPYFPAGRLPGLFPAGIYQGPPPAAVTPAPSAVLEPGMIFCFKCGAKIYAEAEICPHCGVRQKRQSTSPLEVLKGPNKVIAACLAFFLGPLGAHKFYLNRIGLGILYLVFGTLLVWLIVPPIVVWTFSIIDGIVYLTYTDEEFAATYGQKF